MAKKTTGKSGKSKEKTGAKTGTAIARVSPSTGSNGGSKFDAGDAFIKLLQSPLVAELVAVAATAALAALAENGFTNGETRGKRAGKAVKEAGKAAAAAVGRRLTNEIDEIRKAATESRAA